FSCPNREKDRSGGCVFCDGTGASATYLREGEGIWKRDSSFQKKVAHCGPRKRISLEKRLESLEFQVEKGTNFIKERYNTEGISLYFQAWTSTYAPIDELKAIFDKGLSLYPFTEFIVSTRPDCLDEDVIKLLVSYKQKVKDVWVEVGLQSGNNITLDSINRGHDVETFKKAVIALHNNGIKVSVHIITGLPNEGYKEYDNTIKLINELKIEAIKIHNLDILGGTALFDEYIRGELTVASTSRAIEHCIYFLRRLSPSIIIQRLLCETPPHRLAAPRNFYDKSKFIQYLQRSMNKIDAIQGDLYNGE
ncbi:MAG: TIGR01212 family radical SAM protein, partial [Sphaerochaetaceae bacterium]|nr:TIGR01212 family radical SAM protein [Sphaerochaetaceae bacterium]